MSEGKPLKVIVCGGGIGGLTAAHELAKRGVDVVVYERNDRVGGLARSSYSEKDGHQYPVEYSWRVYGTEYKNLLRILSEIPLRSGEGKTVRDRLHKVRTYIFPRVGKHELVFSPLGRTAEKDTGFGFTDNVQMLEKILYCLTMSQARMDALDPVTWTDFCKDLSPEARKYLVTMWGPVLGMDPTFMSVPSVARFVGSLLAKYGGTADAVNVLNMPTNDGWFDEWTAALEKTGHVQIHTNKEIADFIVEEGKIAGVVVDGMRDTADYVICGMGVEAIAVLVAKNADLARDPMLKKTMRLAELCRQVQLSVQVFLDDEMSYPSDEPPILYLPDSPWALIIEPQEMVWGKTYCTDPRVKSVLSVGICQTDVPGIVHGKAFTACTEKEIEEETVAQMAAAYEKSRIRMKDGGAFSASRVIRFYLWDSFQFDPATKRIEVWEPKFSNNAGSLPFQPETSTGISNLLFATAYTKTDRYVYSMESAAEAGTRAANEILRREGTGTPTPVYPFPWAGRALRPLVWIDAALFRLGLPHLGRTCGSAIAVVILYAAAIIAVVVLALHSFFA